MWELWEKCGIVELWKNCGIVESLNRVIVKSLELLNRGIVELLNC